VAHERGHGRRNGERRGAALQHDLGDGALAVDGAHDRLFHFFEVGVVDLLERLVGITASLGMVSRMRPHSSTRRVPSMMMPVTSTCRAIISICGSSSSMK
jgi:hypothetical protein